MGLTILTGEYYVRVGAGRRDLDTLVVLCCLEYISNGEKKLRLLKIYKTMNAPLTLAGTGKCLSKIEK